MRDPKDVQLNVRISKADSDWLDWRSDLDDTSRSDLVREAIAAYRRHRTNPRRYQVPVSDPEPVPVPRWLVFGFPIGRKKAK